MRRTGGRDGTKNKRMGGGDPSHEGRMDPQGAVTERISSWPGGTERERDGLAARRAAETRDGRQMRQEGGRNEGPCRRQPGERTTGWDGTGERAGADGRRDARHVMNGGRQSNLRPYCTMGLTGRGRGG
jgi:hypothetical protein